MQIPKCTRLALYVGPNGRESRWPMTEDMEAPRSVTMKSGEVRELRMVQYDDVTVEEAFSGGGDGGGVLMPTGYTADVQSGKVTDFATFALRCARAFGATVMQRDNPMDEPPKHREPTDYHVKALAEARTRLAELLTMSEVGAETAAEAEFVSAVRRREEQAARMVSEEARYRAMMEQVKAWEPPTREHLELKAFMLKQLTESIDFDCHPYGDAPVRLSGAEWHKAAIKKTRRDIEYHLVEEAKEQERCANANAWIDALYESLGAQVAR